MPALAEPASARDSLVAPETARDELDALYKGLQSAHFDLYAHQPEEAHARYQALREGFDEPISPILHFSSGNLRPSGMSVRGSIFRKPFTTAIAMLVKDLPHLSEDRDGRAYVGEDYSGAWDIQPGDEIRAGRIDMAQWLVRTAQHLSADTPYIAHSFWSFALEIPLVEHGNAMSSARFIAKVRRFWSRCWVSPAAILRLRARPCRSGLR